MSLRNDEALRGALLKTTLDDRLPVIDVRRAEPLHSTTSKGNQLKWYLEDKRLFVKGRFCTRDGVWRDFIVENLASKLGKQLDFFVIPQEMCFIRTSTMVCHGSCSRNFLRDSEQFITFFRLYRTLPYTEYPQDWFMLDETTRLTLAVNAYKAVTGLDITDYLWQMIVLDYLVGNEDRHMSNFGVIFNSVQQKYRIAPLFDFGLGLFEHDLRYANLSLPQSIKAMRFKPFGIDQKKVYQAACKLFNRSMEAVPLNMAGLYFPSKKALSYFEYVCFQMGFDLQGEGEVI